jgi:hypothetical protein
MVPSESAGLVVIEKLAGATKTEPVAGAVMLIVGGTLGATGSSIATSLPPA